MAARTRRGEHQRDCLASVERLLASALRPRRWEAMWQDRLKVLPLSILPCRQGRTAVQSMRSRRLGSSGARLSWPSALRTEGNATPTGAMLAHTPARQARRFCCGIFPLVQEHPRTTQRTGCQGKPRSRAHARRGFFSRGTFEPRAVMRAKLRFHRRLR